MKKRFLYLIVFGTIIAGIFIADSCKKTQIPSPPPSMAMFAVTNATLPLVKLPAPVDTVPLQLTQPLTEDAIISFSVSSPTGAKEGVQYTLDSTSVLIGAGTVVPAIPLLIHFDINQYKDGRVDTLILTINSNQNGVSAFPQSKTLTLVVRYTCPIILEAFTGSLIINDPDLYVTKFSGAGAIVNSDTLAVSGMFGQPNYTMKVYINTNTGESIVPYQILGNTLPSTSYTHPSVQGSGTLDGCSGVLSINITYKVDQGTFSGSHRLIIYK